MMKACVIGWPISHSRSPMIHGYWIKTYRLDASYTRIPVRPEDLPGFIENLQENGLAGCNVTIPHKEKVYDLIHPNDDTTVRLRAVNTVFVRDGRMNGTNTDGEGYIQSLRSQISGLDLDRSKAVVLGAGGAAAAIVDILLQSGVEHVCIVNRSLERATALRSRFDADISVVPWGRGADVLGEARLLVNTTSLGMSGQPELDIDLARLPDDAIVSDIVYSPLRTRLLVDAAHRGLRTAEGLGMLLHQAVRGFELWFGIRPVVTPELYGLVARDIDPGYGS